MKKLKETSLPSNFITIMSTQGLEVTPIEYETMVKTVVAGVTDYLRLIKSKTIPAVVAIRDLKGNFIVAAVVEYNEAENEDEVATGNWNYYWTFYENDIPDGSNVKEITDLEVFETVSKRGLQSYRFRFMAIEYMHDSVRELFTELKDFLDQNAKDEEGYEMGVELEGYFEASVRTEGGEKVLSILPAGEMKSLIKDDTASEK